MKNIFYILLGVFLIGMSCNEVPSKVNDCSEKIDSTNNYWIDVVKNLSAPDTILQVDTVSQIDTISQVDTLFIKDSVDIVEVKIDFVKADTVVKDALRAANLVDNEVYVDRNNKGTRWAAPGYPHSAVLYFDTTYVVTSVWLNTFGWDEGYTHDVELYYYADKISSITTKKELYSRHEVYYVGNFLYIKIVGGGNDWTDLGGVKVFGYKLERQ